jgi:uncharacterized protein YukE
MENNTIITPESVLASVKEMFAASDARFDRALAKSRAEADQRRADFDRALAKSRAEFEKEMKQYNQRSAELNEQLKQLGEQVGGWNNSHGRFAEEFFINSFKRGHKNFFGERFNDIMNNLKGTETDDEFDIVLLNGHSVAIVEVKFKVRDKDIKKIVKKSTAFKINYPKYQHHLFYIGMASLVFEKGAEQDCVENGIAVIKQIGDTVIINDKNLKTF